MIFSFAGMQRSGNHAIIEWFALHFDICVLSNNILGYAYNDECAQVERFDNPFGTVEHTDIFSWENFNPFKIVPYPNSDFAVIIRDPYNWWASWFRYLIPNPNVHTLSKLDTIPLYLDYVEYAKRNPIEFISFNSWFSSFAYRRELEQIYGMRFNDDSINTVSDYGCGSSFDGMSKQGKAQEMKVLNRYETVKHLPDYKVAFEQFPELHDVARELFDMEPIKV